MKFIINGNNMIVDTDKRLMPIYALLLDFINNTSIYREENTATIHSVNNEKYLRKLFDDFLYEERNEKKLVFKHSNENYNDTIQLISDSLDNYQYPDYRALSYVQEEIKELINLFFIDKKVPVNLLGFNIDIKYGFEVHNNTLLESVNIKDIETFCLFAICKLFSNDTSINKCENCGKYFVPLTRNDEIYCDNEYNNGRSCKQVGYENKIKNDDILKEYRRVYKNKNAYKQRTKNKNSHAEADFKKWVYAAKFKLDDCRENIITLDEFKEWLNNN